MGSTSRLQQNISLIEGSVRITAWGRGHIALRLEVHRRLGRLLTRNNPVTQSVESCRLTTKDVPITGFLCRLRHVAQDRRIDRSLDPPVASFRLLKTEDPHGFMHRGSGNEPPLSRSFRQRLRIIFIPRHSFPGLIGYKSKIEQTQKICNLIPE